MTETSLPGTSTQSDDKVRQSLLKERGMIPSHIAIIMDGNGRWARAQGKPRVFGHHEGVISVRDIAEACAELGVDHLTLYTFSTENWQRPRTEVNALMELLIRTLRKEKKTFFDNDISLRALGDLNKLPPACQKEFSATIEETRHHTRMTLNLALSYSGRWEITEAMKSLARQVASGSLSPEAIDADTIAGALSTAHMPDPELLIRTGGDYRISNFLLWQLAYTELYITESFWPSFRREQLYQAIQSFQDRDRRFGRVHDE